LTIDADKQSLDRKRAIKRPPEKKASLEMMLAGVKNEM
jgi:hypothetical protein